MNKKLVEIVARLAVFLEFAEDSVVDQDAAVRELENLAFHLRQLSPSERQEFVQILDEVAQAHPFEQERRYLMDLPKKLGVK